MKKLLFILYLCFCCPIVNAALNASTVWEVRTTGASTNGGGFYNRNPGTSVDYSQQDSAQLSLTDLASTSASGWLTVTSATGGFTAAMVGNIVYIASGTNFTAGYYEITAYTDTNTITVDRACGATADASGGSGKVGGATDHPQNIASSVVAGNRIWIKSGTYQPQGANTYVLNHTVAPSNEKYVSWIGYYSTRDDIYLSTNASNRPVFDGNDVASGYSLTLSAVGFFKNIRFMNTANSVVYSTSSISPIFENCKIDNGGSHGIYMTNASATVYLYNCEANNNTGSGIYGAAFYMTNCYIHDNSQYGIRVTGTALVIGSIIDSQSNHGFIASSWTGIGIIKDSVFYNNTGASVDGINISGSSANIIYIMNNIFNDNGRYGVNLPTTRPHIFDYNCLEGNGTGAINGGSFLFPSKKGEVTSDPLFTDAANGDFTLQSGSPCLNTGIPSSMAGATGSYKWNIGVDQDDNTTGGSATDIFGVIQ